MKNPKAKENGFSKQIFDIKSGHPYLKFGGVIIKNCPIPIMLKGLPLFKILPPEEEGAPFRFSGNFCDSKGNFSLKIVDNEWFVLNNNWDVEVSGGKTIIRERGIKINLKLV